MGGLIKKAATTAATVAGGPVAGAVAGFGSSALSGGNLYNSLANGISGGVAGDAAKKATGTLGSKLKDGLGFGSTADTLNTLNNGIVAPMSSPQVVPPMESPQSLLDTLRQRRIDLGM